MKKFKLEQLAGKQVEGTGMGSGRPGRYERKINFSTEDPPLIFATLGADKVFAEGGGGMQPEPRMSPMPVWGAHLADYTGEAVSQPVSQPGSQPGDRAGDRQKVPGGRLINGDFVLNGVGEGGEQHPSGQETTAGEPWTEEPGPKRPKLTPVDTPGEGDWTKHLETEELQGGQGQDVPNDAQEEAGKMGVKAEVGTQ